MKPKSESIGTQWGSNILCRRNCSISRLTKSTLDVWGKKWEPNKLLSLNRSSKTSALTITPRRNAPYIHVWKYIYYILVQYSFLWFLWNIVFLNTFSRFLILYLDNLLRFTYAHIPFGKVCIHLFNSPDMGCIPGHMDTLAFVSVWT